jgi:hypothetical protein
MSRRLKVGSVLVVTTLVGLTLLTTQAGGAPQTADTYAVKFNCGEFGKSVQPAPAAKVEGPYKPGNYQTAINIHNPQLSTPVTFQKKAVLLYKGKAPVRETVFEQPQPPGQLKTADLPPDFGMLIDCQDIRAVLLPGAPAAPMFIEGWVVIIVNAPASGAPALPLDVTAVYTSHGFNCESSTSCASPTREGFSEEVVTILPRTVTG